LGIWVFGYLGASLLNGTHHWRRPCERSLN
jgi:hypothetical protein